MRHRGETPMENSHEVAYFIKGGVIMTLVRWNPFNEIEELSNFFNDRFFTEKGENELSFWKPTSDITETKHAYKVKAEMPGIPKDDIAISVKGNVLTIKGEKKKEKKEKDANFHHTERVYGLYQRQLVIPEDVKADKIRAGYKDGVLELYIPKGEEAKPKEIRVE